MEVIKQIEENELSKIKEVTNKLNEINSNIVSLELQKHNLLHIHAGISNEFSEIKKELENKYGKVLINIETGEYKEEEEEEENLIKDEEN
jgi:hypothetical protein